MKDAETKAATPMPSNGWWKGGGGAFVALLIVVAVIGPFEYVEQILLGWLYFPLGTIPKASVDWPTAILGVTCVFLFVVGLHFTGRWLLYSTALNNNTPRPQWTWRCSWVLAGTLLVLFGSGTALVGVTHQFIWLLSGRPNTASASAGVSPGFIGQARNAARTTQAKNELRMHGLAFQSVIDVQDGRLPPGGTMTESGELLHGSAAFLGPYHSYDTSGIDFSIPWHQPPNDRIYKSQLSCFVNPSMPGAVFDANGYALNHWSGNVHVLPLQTLKAAADETPSRHDVSNDPGMSLEQITDGTNNTILIGSAGGAFMPWGHPANLRDPAKGINNSPHNFGGPDHWSGAMFGFCDGSEKLLSNQTDPAVLEALARPADGVSEQ